MRTSLLFIIALALMSCSDKGVSPQDREFNILMKFGVGSRNELNTFQNTYTKDLVLDGTLTVPLVLSESELNAIKAKLEQIDFFSYPEHLPVLPNGSALVAVEPHSSYQIEIKNQSTVKTVYWDDALAPIYFDIQRKNLQEIVAFISNIVNQKPEIAKLPSARGGYL